MFGMGMTEILLIAIIAVIALGPDKLPDAMIKIAKFINSFKNGISEAKNTLNNELNISEIKEEFTEFKAQIEKEKENIKNESKIDFNFDEVLEDEIQSKKDKNNTLLDKKEV